ncbi:hypothetical protein K438DRAFT_442351 [Mycena galopus ATCC 62051]|nr:hypothetical protein K438DRAFT_442351 [Mycena galopus ATCC 62051]
MSLSEFCRQYRVSDKIRRQLDKQGFETVGALLEVSDTSLRKAGLKSGQIAELKRALEEFVPFSLSMIHHSYASQQARPSTWWGRKASTILAQLRTLWRRKGRRSVKPRRNAFSDPPPGFQSSHFCSRSRINEGPKSQELSSSLALTIRGDITGENTLELKCVSNDSCAGGVGAAGGRGYVGGEGGEGGGPQLEMDPDTRYQIGNISGGFGVEVDGKGGTGPVISSVSRRNMAPRTEPQVDNSDPNAVQTASNALQAALQASVSGSPSVRAILSPSIIDLVAITKRVETTVDAQGFIKLAGRIELLISIVSEMGGKNPIAGQALLKDLQREIQLITKDLQEASSQGKLDQFLNVAHDLSPLEKHNVTLTQMLTDCEVFTAPERTRPH